MPDEESPVTPFPFATVPELRKRWKGAPEDADDDLEVALEDASQFILDIAPSAAQKSASTRRRIVCAVVKRSMAVPDEYEGFSQVQMGAGPYQRTGSVTNAHGDFYLTRLEKQALGVGRQVASEVNMLAGHGDAS
ncbi:hypothetical protein ACTXMZ_15455 [Brachybacterium alimentarium]|uniref:hypothetical protein n=1 Tax=Brachybacterium alimentarium TaxID=47845 RepID=UPI003FD1DBFA